MRTRNVAALCVLVAVLPSYALARDMFVGSGSFQLEGRPIGGAQPAAPTPAYLSGARVAAAGPGALVIDEDSGALIKTDAAGGKLAQLPIARGAGLLAFDGAAQRAYVADRKNDRIAVVDTETLAVAASIRTPAEPYGVALMPDRKQLLVSTIADRALVAYDVASGRELWRTALGSEPRGIAVSPDGARALVSYLTTGTVDEIDLRESHRAAHHALASEVAPRRCRRCGPDGDAFARGSFTVAFMGPHQAVVPFQRETPVQNVEHEKVGAYGGGDSPPLTHELAFFGFSDGAGGRGASPDQTTAQISPHQARALAWDQARDALYVAGLGNDSITAIEHASQASIANGRTLQLSDERSTQRCGPDGLAIGSNGKLIVWCSFSRSIKLIDAAPDAKRVVSISDGPELVASAMTGKQHAGMVLFHTASSEVSASGALACSSCHPDQRADGLSWRIEKRELQTPLLSGRLVGTHPFKWDGGDPTLRDSLTSTMQRLGGTGLSRKQTDSLAAYLEALPAPRTPTREATQVARGKQLFDSEGCRSCHAGTTYTDRERHKLTGSLKVSDTPSLIGVAASAPYFHDGSAATLEALLRDRGAVHGMADTAKLSDQQVSDLTAFLETL